MVGRTAGYPDGGEEGLEGCPTKNRFENTSGEIGSNFHRKQERFVEGVGTPGIGRKLTV